MYFKNERQIQRSLRLLLGCYWLAMFIGTHVPRKIPDLSLGWIDKALHLIAFAGLALLLAINWQWAGRHLNSRHYLAVWVLLMAYAVVDELLQIPIGRTASVYDWIADAAGAALGLFFFHLGRPWILARLKGSIASGQ